MPMKRMKRPPLRDPPPQVEPRSRTPSLSEGEPSMVRKGRGTSKMQEARIESERPSLTVVGDMDFEVMPACEKVNQVKTTIRQIVLGRLDEPYLTYLSYSKDLMKKCLEEFLQRYRWADGQDPDRCRQVFNNIAADRFTDSLTKARTNCKKKYGMDTQKWKEMPPSWCKNPDVWNRLCDNDKWGSADWKQVSLQNSENRMSGDNVVHHVSGSASGYRHAKKMEKEIGKKPSFLDVYVRTHVLRPDENGDRHFVDARSKQVLDSFNEMRTERRGNDLSTYPPTADEEDLDLWLLASGGYAHGKFYGVPSLISDNTIPIELRKRRRASRHTASATISPSTGSSRGADAVYTAAEVRDLLDQQERRHQEQNRCNKVLFDAIFAQLGINPPTIPPVEHPTVPSVDSQSRSENDANEEHDDMLD